jgi:hypothetical protein
MIAYSYLRSQVKYDKSQIFFEPFKAQEDFVLEKEFTQIHEIINLWYDKRESENVWSRFFIGGNPQAYWCVIFTKNLHFKGETRLKRTLTEKNIPELKGIFFIEEKHHSNFDYWKLQEKDFLRVDFYGQILKLVFPPLLHPFSVDNKYPSSIVKNRIECRKAEVLLIINSYLGMEALLLKDARWKKGVFIAERDPVKAFVLQKNIKLNNGEDRITVFKGTANNFIESSPYQSIDIWNNIKEKTNFPKNNKKIRLIHPQD